MKTQREVDVLAVRAELRLAKFYQRFMKQYMRERLETPQAEVLNANELVAMAAGREEEAGQGPNTKIDLA